MRLRPAGVGMQTHWSTEACTPSRPHTRARTRWGRVIAFAGFSADPYLASVASADAARFAA
jgi:hypothetical protein